MFPPNTNQLFSFDKPLSFFAFVVLLCFTQLAFAADIFWTNANGTNNWSDPLNWSTGTVPVAGDVAIFDLTSVANCTIDTNVNVDKIDVRVGYTGILTQGLGINLNTANDAMFNGGTFIGADSNITIGTDLTIDIPFTSTTGTLELNGNYTLSGGNFVHNSGTVLVRGITKTISGVQTFNNLTLSNSNHGTLNLSDDITVAGTLTINSNVNSNIDGGTIYLEGDAVINNSATGGGGTGTINISGNTNQSITGNSTVGRGELPNVIIDKSGGVLTFNRDSDGIVSVAGDWTYLAGTIDHATNDATIALSSPDSQINGIQSFHNLRLHASNHGTFTLNDPITVTGLLSLSGSNTNLYLNGAELTLEGDMLLENTGGSNSAGNGTIRISGNQNQTITGNSPVRRGALPNVIIDKSGGVLTFDRDSDGVVSVEGDWTYLAGMVDYITNDATIAFVQRNQTISGVQNFHNFWIYNCCNGSMTVNDDITVTGQLTYSGGSGTALSGNIYAEGDIRLETTGPYNGGSGTFYITGNQNQNIVSVASVGRGEIPNVIVNKSGGTATFNGVISIMGDWSYIAGNVDYATNDATIALTAHNQSISGVQSFHKLQLYRAGHGTTTLNNEITVTNSLVLGSESGPTLLARTDVDGAPINLLGNMIISNHYTYNKGTSTIRINGTSDQTITSRVGLGEGELPFVEINKGGGTATFIGIVSTSQDWNYINGNVDYATNDATIGFTDRNQTINGVQTFHNLQFHHAGPGGSITITDGITVNNQFTITGSNNVTSIDGQPINVRGDMTISNTSLANAGNGTIRIEGNSNQTITSTAGLRLGELPNVEIDKSGGIATFNGLFSIYGDWNYLGGNLDYSTNDATIAFTDVDQTIDGVQDFHNLQFHSAAPGTMRINDEINVSNLFTFSGWSQTAIDNQPINVLGDMDITNNTSTVSGTGLIRISGTTDQGITSTSVLSRGRLPNVEINKTAGLATIDGIISINGNFEYVDGNVDAVTNSTNFAFYGPGTIDGEGPTGNMNFYDLSLQSGAVRNLTGDIEISNVFYLRDGHLHMNSNAVYLSNAAATAIDWTNGRLIGETSDNESAVHWNIGTDTNPHTIPFVTAVAHERLYVTIENTDGGDLGKVSVSTYPTDAANLPYPVTPDVVTNMNNSSGYDDSDRAIDRFWQLEKSETTGTAEVTFMYADPEITGGTIGQENSLLAKRYDSTNDTWGLTSSNQTINATTNSIVVSGLTQFSPWALFMIDDPDNDLVDSSIDLDDDNDGILDTIEGFGDTDLDGVLNKDDLDSDNDGIYDVVEGGAIDEAGVTEDGDGMIDGAPTTFGANGLFNAIENNDTLGATATFTVRESADDTDTLFNFLDLDSDGDGIPDNIEGQPTHSFIPANGTYDLKGLDSSYPNGIDPTNTDGIDLPDYLDTDSDNEGANDTVEASITLTGNDADNDGLDDVIDTTVDYLDPSGTIDIPVLPPVVLPDTDLDVFSGGDLDFRDAIDNRHDNDNDGIVDAIDLDDDNDGILDSDELACSEEITDFNSPIWNYGTGSGADASGSSTLNGVPFTIDFSLNGGSKIFVPTSQYTSNSTLQGIGNPGSLLIGGGDATGNNGESLTLTFASPVTILVGLDQVNNVTTVNEGWLFNIPANEVISLPDNTQIIGAGTVNGYEAINSGALFTDIAYFKWNNITSLVLTGKGLPSTAHGLKSIQVLCDSDNDGLPNHWDLDSDGDGILDTIEAGHGQSHTNGQLTGSVGADGIPDIVQADPDGGVVNYSLSESIDDVDTISDFLDLDSDGDGIPDKVEAQTTVGYVPPNTDDTATYASNNGVNSAYLGGVTPTNTDGADNPDYLDTDSDNEGGNDTLEAQITLLNVDADNDGLDDATDADTLGYGDPGGTIDDPLSGAIILLDTDKDASSGGDVDFRDAQDDRLDTDTDGIVDAIDLDDDNDGLLDSEELNVIVGNTQPECTGETILDFSTAPTLESGTALIEGAVYRFPNVTAGTDALITILETFNASVADIDNNAAEPQAFRPRTAFDISNVGKEGYIEYQVQFVNTGGTTAVTVPKFFININDTDGNVDYSEEIYVENPSSYIISNPTELSVSYEFPWIVATGGTTEYAGAGNTFPQINFGINYENRSEIRFRAGITTIVPAVAASGREHNLDFRCTTNYINPEIYVLDSDKDGYPNPIDLDTDNDGILDAVEAGHGQSHTNGRVNGNVGADGVPDAVQTDPDNGSISYAVAESSDDADGMSDFGDLDSDGDGIPDNVEGQTTIGYIAPNGTVDGNGVDLAYTSGINPTNTDGADNPDYVDADSDNDSQTDLAEALKWVAGTDSDNDGLDDRSDNDLSGYSDPGGTIDNPLNAPIILPDEDNDATTGGDVDFRDAQDDRPDNDNDGMPDVVDLDDDNDGILDTDEGCGNLVLNGSFERDDFTDAASYVNASANGAYIGSDLNTDQISAWNYTQNMDAWVEGGTWAPAFHGRQYMDLIGNATRSGGIMNQFSQVINTVPGNTYTLSLYWGEDRGHGSGGSVDLQIAMLDTSNTIIFSDMQSTSAQGTIGGVLGPNTWYYYESTFVATTAQTTLQLTSNAPGPNFYSGANIDFISVTVANPATCLDTDGDGIIDAFDLDSDNDGIFDAVEASHGQPHTNGIVNGNVGTDGVPDSVQNNPDGETINYVLSDSDSDGVNDILDLDADGDGIPDNVEAQTTIGYIAPSGTIDTNGIDTVYSSGLTPINTDGADNPDYLDTDSDNEGGDDTSEGAITLTGNDTDNDGLDDATDATPDYSDVGGTIDNPLSGAVILPDSDGDATTGGDVDFRDAITDLDSDDDGILDSFEDLNSDGDNNPATNPTNSDDDIYPDYLDIDSDNDGIPDNVEAQTTSGYIPPSLQDTNGNGLDDAYESGVDIGLIPVNTDGTDLPDYLDDDSDNDNVPDTIEGNDHNHDGIPDVILIASDKDDDGLDDNFEGTEQIDIDVNDEIDSPQTNLPDTDGDGESDYRDIDDDGDGLDTITEDINGDNDYANDDSDNDGTPDYLDPDVPPVVEDVEVFNVVTPNGDGIHDELMITGLDTRPKNTLQIFNRWGVLVYSTESYNTNGNVFDGTSQARATYNQGDKLPAGTYFYVLNYEDIGGENKSLSGHIYLN